MISRSAIIRTAGVVTIVAAIISAAFSFGLVRNSLEDIRKDWQQNLLWPSSQLEIEFIRFRGALAGFGQGPAFISSVEVNRRFDILWSRAKLFEEGKSGYKIEKQPESMAILWVLMETMTQQEAAVVGLMDGDLAAAAMLFNVFSKFDIKLRKFNRSMMHYEVALGADLRVTLYSNYIILTWIGVTTFLVSFVLLLLFAVESRRQRRFAVENLRLFQQARSANLAKTAFLSMMSHGLRTPMNGILGMIALAKPYSVDAQQSEHLEQASDASKQMNDLLHDLLDFSSLDATTVDPLKEPFELARLQRKIVDTLAPFARREGLNVSVKVVSEADLVLLGDRRHLCRAIIHLAWFLGRNSANQPLDVEISYERGVFKVTFTFLSGQSAGVWHPELVLGPVPQDKDGFSNDALNPAIARGFVENMGGRLVLRLPETDGETAVVVLSVPLEQQRPAEVIIRIEMRSVALQAICESALSAAHVRFFQPGEIGIVDVVIVETGSEPEQDICIKLRGQYPKARLVVLGSPKDPTLFDGQIKLPIDVVDLRRTVII